MPSISSIRGMISKEMSKKTTKLNIGYFCSTLGDKMWMFAIGVFMHKLGGMTWVAGQQLFEAAIKLIFLPQIGEVLDHMDRNRAVQDSLLVNNISVAASAACFCVSFWLGDTVTPILSKALLALATLFASLSRLASEAQKMAFTKDWIVVITQTNPDISLSTQNARMTIIDQFSSVVLPAATGIMFDFFNRTFVCIIIIAYNLFSWIVESQILRNLYHTTPELARKDTANANKDDEKGETKKDGAGKLRIYFRQSSFAAAFGLALLYMTVLGFDNLAGSYGQKHGMSMTALGVLRTTGSILGMAGAISYSYLAKCVGILWAAFLGLTIQNIFINTSAVSTMLPGSPMNVTGYFSDITFSRWFDELRNQVQNPANQDGEIVPFFDLPPSIIVFFFGITFARFGLWIADPAITQIMQETIPETERYRVFSTQTAFCESFSLLKDVIVIAFASTELFGGLAIISSAFVFLGYLFYNFYFVKTSCTKNVVSENKEMQVIRGERDTLLDVERAHTNNEEEKTAKQQQ